MKISLHGNLPLQFAMLDNLYEEFSKDPSAEVVYSIDQTDSRFVPLLTRAISRIRSENKTIANIDEFNPDVVFIACQGANPHKGKIVNLMHSSISKGLFSCLYPLKENEIDLHLVHSNYYKDCISNHLKKEILVSGCPKLDKLFNKEYDVIKIKSELNIPLKNKVILYAPTYNSELSSLPFIGKEIPQLASSDTTVMVKLHDCSVDDWEQYYKLQQVTYIEDYNISKYLAVADVMISDNSGCGFEFITQNKPLILFSNKNRVEFYSRIPNEVTPEEHFRVVGEKVTNFVELKQALNRIFETPVNFKSCTDFLFDYQGKASAKTREVVYDKLL